MAEESSEPVVIAKIEMALKPAEHKLLQYLQMLQNQSGDRTMHVTLHISRGRIEVVDTHPIKRIVFTS